MNTLNSYADNLLKTMQEFFKKNYPLLIAGFAAGLFVYGYDVVNFTLSIDEEINWLNNIDGMAWVTSGRLGTYLLLYVLPFPNLPFIAPVFALLCMTFAATLTVSHHNVSNLVKSVFVVLFMSYPMYAHMQEFTILTVATAVSVLLALIAYKLFCSLNKNNMVWYSALITLMLAFVCSVYQTFMFVFLMPIMIDIIISFSNKSTSLSKVILTLLKACLFLIGAVILYYLISFITAGGVSDGYNSQFLSWGRYDTGVIASRVFTQIYRFLIGVRGYPVVNILILPVIILTALTIAFNKKLKPIYSLYFIILSLMFIIAAFSTSILMGSPLPYRSLASTPFLFAGVLFIYAIYAPKIGQLLLSVAMFFIVLINASTVTKLFMSDDLMTEADRMTAVRVLANVYDKAPDFLSGKYKIAFIGMHDTYYRSPLTQRTDVFGASFWSWDSGNPTRMLPLLKMFGLPNNIRLASHEEEKFAIEFSKTMPSYPHKDSVAVIGDVVVVKLSESTK